MGAVDGEDDENRVIERQKSRFGWMHGTALILLAAAVLLAPAALQRAGFRGFVVLYAIAAVAWIAILRRTPPLSRLAVMVIALALRLPFLVVEPRLSGDVYRYLSDGRMLAGGVNPYTYTPSDPRINHPEIRSIYPPHAQLLFAAVHDLSGWRLLIVGVDLLALFLLRDRALAYATSPLVIFEGVWSGHLDAIAAVLLLVALTTATAWLRGAALALAGGLKIIPLAAAPLLARGAHRKSVAAFFAVLVLPVIPFLGAPIMPGFRDYATRWIFNSPAYALVRALVARVPAKELWTDSPLRIELWSDFVYRHLDPDFLTRALLAIAAIIGILLARRVTTAVGVLLLCSPAIHPWYWLALVPAALTERSRGWLALALCAPASYLLYDGVSPLVVYAICYGLPAAACVAGAVRLTRARWSARSRTSNPPARR
ncbi:MAG TPA: hypothetical protein VFO89_04540 [Thermoanaerobaculia bacterium]|nr:hypothetical protein [Thermoanaerobaculia bacterium]